MSSDRLSSLFRSFDPQHRCDEDNFFTTTSTAQKRVEDTCFEVATTYCATRPEGERVPPLYKELHAAFCLDCLVELPRGYKILDASRTWLCYWAVHSLNLLKEPIADKIKTNIIRFLKTCEHPGGGYGGGPGQLAHLATTYAAVLCLVSLEDEEALKSIDREKTYAFLRAMKQRSGAYTMHHDGEIDMRAPYLGLVVAALLRIIDKDLTDGVAEWIAGCQTYEGGFSGEPGAEAHGGYTFCGFATLCLLDRVRLADVQLLLRWLAKKHMAFEGGFQGRTNKLVDGCYSFWQAAVFRLVDTEMVREGAVPLGAAFDSRALQEYILVCCQDPSGGMIDKPPCRRDLYHTCYVLSGLAIAQSFVDDKTLVLGGLRSLLEETHPIFNVTVSSEKFCNDYFSAKL